MAILEIPLAPIPHQIVSAVINGQVIQIEVRQAGSSVYTSSSIDGVQITQNLRAVNRGELFPWSTREAQTQIFWRDTQGDADPRFDGLGTRWLLVFESTEE